MASGVYKRLAMSAVVDVARKLGTKQMSDSGSKFTDVEHVAPPLAPIGINDILRDADVLIELMGKEPLGVVAELANTLTVSAHQAGARDIEEAASNVRRLASGHGPVALTGAMRELTDAIARTERALAA
jgi:hypothetical protein